MHLRAPPATVRSHRWINQRACGRCSFRPLTRSRSVPAAAHTTPQPAPPTGVDHAGAAVLRQRPDAGRWVIPPARPDRGGPPAAGSTLVVKQARGLLAVTPSCQDAVGLLHTFPGATLLSARKRPDRARAGAWHSCHGRNRRQDDVRPANRLIEEARRRVPRGLSGPRRWLARGAYGDRDPLAHCSRVISYSSSPRSLPATSGSGDWLRKPRT